MSNYKYIITCFLAIFLIGNTTWAQHDLGTTFMKESWVSTFHNPAWVPEKRIHIGLPTFYFNSSVSKINIKSLININDNPPILNIDDAIAQIGDEATIGADLEIHPLYFSIAFGDFRLGLEYSITNRSAITIPGDLIRFAAYGNAPYIDQTLNLGPNLYSAAYQKIALPFSFEKDKWTFAVKPAVIRGLYSVNTTNSQLDLYTDPEFYQLSLTGDYLIESSSILEVDPDNNFGTSITDDILGQGLSFKSNAGVSLDLGVRFRPTEKLSLGASLTGIGQITWDKNVTAFQSNGSTTFNGLDLNGLVDGDTLDFAAAVDTLVESFQLENLNRETFKTGLSKNIYLSGHYKINNIFDVGAILYGEFLNAKFSPAFALNGRVKAGKILAFGLSYGMRYNRWDNLGANLLLQFGPVQLFAASDNLFAAFNPLGNSTANGRFGMAVAFGKKKILFDEPGLQ